MQSMTGYSAEKESSYSLCFPSRRECGLTKTQQPQDKSTLFLSFPSVDRLLVGLPFSCSVFGAFSLLVFSSMPPDTSFSVNLFRVLM